MATRWHNFGDGSYALTGGSNIGVIVDAGRALIIDAGLDGDSAKKALRALDGVGAEPVAVLITHSHADHFGGAAWLAHRAGAPVYAPPLESAFVAHPLLEPLFLNGGAAPIAELRSKFTLAKEGITPAGELVPGPREIAGVNVKIVPLPGHAPDQVGIGWGETLYCGDAVFPASTLARHPILFCTDLDAWLTTLAALPSLSYTRFVPGHGAPMDEIAAAAERTAARLREIRALVREALASPQEDGDVLRAVAARYGIDFAAPQFVLLALTTIRAALTSLQAAGEATVAVESNRVVWRQA